jgi:phosphatidylserine/phosphatidylglycerophosphate/cardiolipin synthase-like enzyme
MRLCVRPLRRIVREIVNSAKSSLLVASPYIKVTEAEWLVGTLQSNHRDSIQATILTDVRSDSVLSGGLDVEALLLLATDLSRCRVVTLPRLHAKVYVADTQLALVTSANLTPSGLDTNFEYGICTDNRMDVRRIREDLEAYARLGNAVGQQAIREIRDVALSITESYRNVQQTASRKLKQAFDQELKKANQAFLSAQVGRRTAASLFSEAILYALASGPVSTRELHPRIQALLPDLCDDSVELIINGEQFGKTWKHAVRNAQQGLKRSGKIAFDGQKWRLREREGVA